MVLLSDITVNVKFRLKFDTSEVERYFTEHKRLQPVRFGFDCNHAEVLEYGCGPLKHFQPVYMNGQYSFERIYEEIDRWARIKLKMTRKSERKAFVDRLMERMWNRGLYPHPYYRPALIWLEENLQTKFDEGMSLYEIADNAFRIAKKSIMDQGLPYEGHLLEGAFISSIPRGEMGDPKDNTEWVNPDDKARLDGEAGWSARRGRS